jgi:hypothetical protein
MLMKRRGSVMRDLGLAPLSRYRGVWRICGLEPHIAATRRAGPAGPRAGISSPTGLVQARSTFRTSPLQGDVGKAFSDDDASHHACHHPRHRQEEARCRAVQRPAGASCKSWRAPSPSSRLDTSSSDDAGNQRYTCGDTQPAIASQIALATIIAQANVSGLARRALGDAFAVRRQRVGHASSGSASDYEGSDRWTAGARATSQTAPEPPVYRVPLNTGWG